MAVLGAGVAAGVVGVALSWLLHLIQYIAFGYTHTDFLVGVEHASRLRRVLAPAVGALVCGLVWMILRRRRLPTVADCVADDRTPLPVRRTTLDALTQIIIVGTGSSIGREQAPRQTAAAIADWLSRTLAVDATRRRLVVASAAGAGLAAVYNVPLAGAVFALEVIGLGIRSLENTIVAAVISLTATVVAWAGLGTAPTYTWTQAAVTWQVWIWSLVCVPLCVAVGQAFTHATDWAIRHQPAATWRLPVALMIASGVVGVWSWWWPELPGNGKGMVQVALMGGAGLGSWAVLLVLKPLSTTLCLASGAAGGTLTPALATGAALGAGAALLAARVGADAPMACLALVCAVGVLTVTQRAPWFAVLFGWELVRPPLVLVGPLLVTALGTHLMARALAVRSDGA